ncbi:hypothetical protein B9G98_04326 [Wickerhamiella sorbophila]|uniref:Uncharacterized protein n=1 Tax=Wickerhamiella sorbophila TaxID=45607 RepID=A0A2T0FNZ0_9ASCO|nr:hypothetical protein B9G98_04326 [Wickerhamiella sorbophila]PRT56706.1 hypothetical protein B9G98_04326 [Wickerhamiella sorbophila]
MPKFFRGHGFLLCIDGDEIKATSNDKSYGATINGTTKNHILKYLGMPREELDLTIEEADDRKMLFSFAKSFEGMRIDVCVVELSEISSINVFEWAVEMADFLSSLQTTNGDLENKISHQEKLLDQMIEAKEKYEEEMLERVCAVLDARHGGHATMLDILEHRRHEQEVLSKDQPMHVDVKLEEIASPELEKVKVEPVSPELDEPLSSASTSTGTTDSDAETTQDENS